MTNLNCGCKTQCTGLAIAASVIIGIITAFLQITAVITITPAFLWVTLGVAIVYLAVVLISSANTSENDTPSCKCPALNTLLTAIIGTVVTSIILLGITFAATSIIGAIIVGLLLLFFSLIITATACLIKCINGCN